jgi:NADH:ubiquinone oxidoreductase subunit 4 (subunit M)
MILAGVLLKLGGYGLLRVFPSSVNFFTLGFVWVSIRLVSIIPHSFLAQTVQLTSEHWNAALFALTSNQT